MSATLTASSPARDNVLIPFLSAICITLFLFFIDEGYYDFRWMLKWGNWIAFIIYMVLLFPVQWVISYVLFRKFHGVQKALMMFCLGIPLTLALFFWIVL